MHVRTALALAAGAVIGAAWAALRSAPTGETLYEWTGPEGDEAERDPRFVARSWSLGDTATTRHVAELRDATRAESSAGWDSGSMGTTAEHRAAATFDAAATFGTSGQPQDVPGKVRCFDPECPIHRPGPIAPYGAGAPPNPYVP